MSIIIDGTNGISYPSWTTSSRPTSPNTGETGYNTTLGLLETWGGTAWLNSGNATWTTTARNAFTSPTTGLTGYNTTLGVLEVYNGSSWVPVATSVNSSVTVSDLQTTTINGGQIAGNRNRIINGSMAIDQRNAGTAQTITAAAALAYTVDRFYAYCTGANVTGQRVTGANAGQYRYQFTGASSVTGISFGQRIETLNSADLAGNIVTLGVDLANSLLTTVTWTAYYANTTDTFGTIASPTRTSIATGTFTVTSTINRYNVQISIPSAAYTGIEIVFSVGAQTSGTWTIGNVQLELGSIATSFERRSYGQELVLCQRYFETSYPPNQSPGSATTAVGWAGFSFNASYTYGISPTPFIVTKRTNPVIIIYAAVTGQQGVLYNYTLATVQGNAGSIYATQYGFSVYCSNGAMSYPTNWFGANFAASAEL